MKTTISKLTKVLSAGLFLSLVAGSGFSTAAAPKRLLVVTLTEGFHHSSIPTAEKVLAQLGHSSGAFSVDYARINQDDPKFQGADGKLDKEKVHEANKEVLAQKMSAAALQNYDGVIFACTTGDLPLPDKEAFLDWIKSGKAFIGMHAAADTFDHHPGIDPYIEMIGAEFTAHHKQCEIDCINQDPKHPACRRLGQTFHVKDEIYLFKNFERQNVHGLLGLDKHPPDGSPEGNERKPGDYPVAWTKTYGKGRVFYTSLGHREDVWDPNTPESFKRENSKEVAEAYQQHILGGIKWALGLDEIGNPADTKAARKPATTTAE